MKKGQHIIQREERICLCGKFFVVQITSKRKFCSKECSYSYTEHKGSKNNIKLPRETRTCLCGCGEIFECKINNSKRYIHNHHLKNKRRKIISKEIRFCKCGCGFSKEVKVNSVWKYKRGHGSGFEKGHIPFNKGKKCEEYIISFDFREWRRDKNLKMLSEHKFPQTNTFPHRLLRDTMKEEGIWDLYGFRDEVIIGFHSCDIASEKLKLAICVDGDYWHCNPLKYPNGPINETQKKNLSYDKSFNTYCKNNGYKVLRFWESDIDKNKENIINELRQHAQF